MEVARTCEIGREKIVVDSTNPFQIFCLSVLTLVFAITSGFLIRDLVGGRFSANLLIISFGHAAAVAIGGVALAGKMLESFKFEYDFGKDSFAVRYDFFPSKNFLGVPGDIECLAMRLDRKIHGRKNRREHWVVEVIWKDPVRRPLPLASIRRRYGAPLFDEAYDRAVSLGSDLSKAMKIGFKYPKSSLD